MIAVIRIKGQVEVPKDADETLNRLRLRKKFACVLIREEPETMGMIMNVRNLVSYGKIDSSTLEELISKRGKSLKKTKLDAKKICEEIMNAKTRKRIEEFGLKPFFSLHPPRGGINSKDHYPKGVLGENEKINELIRRML